MALIDIAPRVKNMSEADSLELVGPGLPIQIEVPAALASELQRNGKPSPTPVSGYALIDTGASMTALDLSVVKKLGLEPVGTAEVGFGEKKERETYAVRVVFPGTNLDPVEFEEAVGLDLGSAVWAKGDIQTIVVLGRDILKFFLLVYNGPRGRVTLAR